MLASNAWVDLQYLRSLSRDGGRGFFSDAIYDLAAYGLHHPQQQWLLMDWGFSNQLLLLSKGAIRKSEVFWGMISDDDPEGQVKQLDRWAGVRDAVFVFHAPACTVYKNPREQFEAWLNRRNLGSETVRVFYHRRGDPAYILKRLVRP